MNIKIQHNMRWLRLCMLWGFFCASATLVADDFNLDASQQVSTYNCSQECIVTGGDPKESGERFIQEKVMRGGKAFFHVVVGGLDGGFTNEYFVAANAATVLNVANTSSLRGSSQSGGGNERAVLGVQSEVSASSWGSFSSGDDSKFLAFLVGSNAVKPLYSGPGGYIEKYDLQYKAFDITGNGTTDPNSVVMRMILKGRGFSLDVFKPLLARKPRITQIVSDVRNGNSLLSEFVADLRGLTYTEMNRPGLVINRLSMQDSGMPQALAANFNMSMAQRSIITAGRYIFTPGAGWLKAVDDGAGGFEKDEAGDTLWVANGGGWDVDHSRFDEGSYTYSDGAGFNVYGAPWDNFF